MFILRPGANGGTMVVYFVIFSAINFGPAPRRIPALSKPGKLGMLGKFRLGSGGNDAAKFGRDVDNPTVPAIPDREVGPPNADDIPPIVVGAPKLAIAPENVFGTPPIVEEIPETDAMEDKEEPAPIDIVGDFNIDKPAGVTLFVIADRDVGGLKDTVGAENNGMSGIC